jgi:hypothetical protein
MMMTDSNPKMSATVPESTNQLPYKTELPKAEFKGTPVPVQLAECGILMAGGLLIWWCFDMAAGNLQFLWAAGIAGVVTVIVLLRVHKTYGNKTTLKHLHDSIVIADRGKELTIPFDKLQAFSASWTDVYTNCIYSTTTVRFNFDVAGSFRVLQYQSDARKGTLKYEQLEALQKDMTAAVSQHMRAALLADGCVPWTLQLTITTAGIDYSNKGMSEPQLIEFSRLGKWEIDRGVFKLALDDDRRPTITEHVSQSNFFPGLVLFAELQKEFGGLRTEPSLGEITELAEPDYAAADSEAI